MGSGNEIREFLTSRRARITPEQVGLRAHGGRRRVSGLRREEVAMLAGISVEYYTQLERGNVRGVSEDVLEAVTRALQLDDVERVHLLDLVRTAKQRPSRGRQTPQRVRPSVQRVLDTITESAAFVRNGRLDTASRSRSIPSPCRWPRTCRRPVSASSPSRARKPTTPDAGWAARWPAGACVGGHR